MTSNKRKTTEQFITEANIVHGKEKYDYSEVEYVNCRAKVKIFCNRCQKFFWQAPEKHLKGQGCPECGKLNFGSTQRFTQDEWIKKSKLIHGTTFDYSMVDYKNAHTKVKLKCNKCGLIFEQSPNNNIRGNGCPKCANHLIKTNEQFEQEARKIHGNLYDYSMVDYKNAHTKVKLKCNKCGQIFLQIPNSHLKGCGCPHCKKSIGEMKIKNILIHNNILFESQKKFKDCKDKKSLPFDFYLPEYNVCIEFQGEQHYTNGFYLRLNLNKSKAEKLFQIQQFHDNIKRKYCKEKGIKLLEIRYDDDIEQKLSFLKIHK